MASANPPGQGVQGKAQDVWQDTKETARSKLNEQKDAAAESLGSFAGALRDVARRGGEGQGEALSTFAGTAADGLERLSGALRNKDVNAMLHDMEAFARRQPVAFFGVALAAGFVAMRFMKAGQPTKEQTPWQ